jgi:hypothetical protein
MYLSISNLVLVLLVLAFNCEAEPIKAYQANDSMIVIPLDSSKNINVNNLKLCSLSRATCKNVENKLDSGVLFNFSLFDNDDIYLLLISKENDKETVTIIERIISSRKTLIEGIIEKVFFVFVGLLVSLAGYFFKNNFDRNQQDKRDTQVYTRHLESVIIELQSGSSLKSIFSRTGLFPEGLNIPYNFPRKIEIGLLKLIADVNKYSEPKVREKRDDFVDQFFECIKTIRHKVS